MNSLLFNGLHNAQCISNIVRYKSDWQDIQIKFVKLQIKCANTEIRHGFRPVPIQFVGCLRNPKRRSIDGIHKRDYYNKMGRIEIHGVLS